MGFGRRQRLGATYSSGEGCDFVLWCPRAEHVELHLCAPTDEFIPMAPTGDGYYALKVPALKAGVRYKYRLNGKSEYPDPASRFQPEGVHGPSQVIADEFQWTDQQWTGLPLHQLIIYELHVGTFSREGTFDALSANWTISRASA